jgi:ubiquinone/menaquinone biosynthesis C-methylase UbiE
LTSRLIKVDATLRNGVNVDSRNRKADHKRLIQQYYSIRAKDYDRQKSRTWKSTLGFGDGVTIELLDALSDFENGLVLEVGVGSGRNALPLLQKIRLRLVGLDLSREMLKLTQNKLSSFGQSIDLVLGDAESLPFVNGLFDAIMCMSTMHYFESRERDLDQFSQILKENGAFVCGDLTVHELDYQGFLQTLEATLSRAHVRYCRPSEMKELMEQHGFWVKRTETFPYRKSFSALMEDKGEYFGVAPSALSECISKATDETRRQYGLTSTELTLFYTVITARKKTGS